MRVFLIFTAVAIGTYIIRVSGIALLSDPQKIPPRVRRALGLVAPTAMGAIIVNALFLDESGWREFGAWHIAAAVAVGVALWRRSAGWAMSLGAAAFALLLIAGV
ncbi:AzlD domain-containing protein [Demequina sp. TTPB684]|uniref:AzlD domain-containing protein n=1 Tax=unclassified Demequina TaxID=2620311 RepID=UPI001CF5DFD3|nr:MULTISPECIES: AzlD domain-containing protein [unclassified Demequina]MCB2411400.1 AzlD domain-containing protein [Demequina sp. TTPB684]UPU87563.1 AzlD domain-containing protein [Demequina sp. TMPB413]